MSAAVMFLGSTKWITNLLVLIIVGFIDRKIRAFPAAGTLSRGGVIGGACYWSKSGETNCEGNYVNFSLSCPGDAQQSNAALA